MLSELEESVLRAVMLGSRDIKKISRLSGIPPIMTEIIVERLIEKNYIDYEFQPTDKAFRETKWIDRKHGFSFHGEDIKKMGKLVIDLTIIIAGIILLSAILYFIGFG